MGKVYICEKTGLKRGVWTPEEDMKLTAYITRYGHWNWRELPRFAGLSRCGKSCRLRWMNYLRPNIKRGNYTKEEEETIIRMHKKLGNRWSLIAASLPGRTDNEIKNYWHTQLKRRNNKHIHSMEANATPAVKCKTVKVVSVTPLILESSDIHPRQTPVASDSSWLSSSYSENLVSTGESEMPFYESCGFDGDFNNESSVVQDSCVTSTFGSETAVVNDTQFVDIAKNKLSSDVEIFDMAFWNELFSVPDSNTCSTSCSGNQVSKDEIKISPDLQPYEFGGNFWSDPFFVEDTNMSNDYALEDAGFYM